MTDRERDFALLASFGGGRRVSPIAVGVIIACTLVIIALSGYSSVLSGGSMSFVVALLSVVTCIFVIIQFAVSGPLVREIERLRAELDALKSQRDAT